MLTDSGSQCKLCLALQGRAPIFPESRMYEGKNWIVDHAYPVKTKGWAVACLKRHAAALHELSPEEFAELAVIEDKIVKAFKEVLDSDKEYFACFSEAEGFKHIHVHLVSVPKDLPDELKGPKIFSSLQTDEKLGLKKEELLPFCLKIKKLLS